MYLDLPNNKQWVIDIETNGLRPSVIWCLCAENVKTSEKITLTNYKDIKEWVDERIKEGCIFIGHNIISFDAAVLNRLVGTRIPIRCLVDTLVLSMLFNPKGEHSLKAWGIKLRCNKIEFDGPWDVFSQEMVTYCIQDVSVCKILFIRLTERMRQIGMSEEGCYIEHHSWSLIKKQKDNGFYFNLEEASKLYAVLRSRENEIKEEIYKVWPPQLLPTKVFSKAFKQNGEETLYYTRHKEQYPKIELNKDGSYTAYEVVEFNLGSPPQRVSKLLELGWVPLEFTKPSKTNPKGNPKPTDKGSLSPSLQKFVDKSGNKEVTLLAKWIAINARANSINTWLEVYDHGTHCIHGNLWLASTLRYRHDGPNTANIPAVRFSKDSEGMVKPVLGEAGYWTYESRDLWTTRDPVNRKLIGVDAKGIQLRVLANYLNNKEFTKQLLEGDPHEYNRQLAGIDTRSKAKTFIYAFLLGAGDEKVGQIIEGSTRQGKETKARFIQNFPGLGDLLKKLTAELARTGRITLCDGSKVLVPSPHMVLGYLLQGDESRIMKKAGILVNEDIRKIKLDVLKVGDIHDEWQSDVHNESITRYINSCHQSFRRAGEHFNYNIPIECDAKIGLTWAETH